MKIQDILVEAPLPDDWDKDMFNSKLPHHDRMIYVHKMAKKLGAGSSRVAFIIPYQGRDTVLKIANNTSGMAQNKFEAKMLSTSFVKKLKIAIPIIDYDEANSQPTWIHVEKAEPITDIQFNSFFGEFPRTIMTNIKDAIKGNSEFINQDNKYVMDLLELIKKYDLPTEDLIAMHNWGIYKGKPVIIDIGLSKEIYVQHYLPVGARNPWAKDEQEKKEAKKKIKDEKKDKKV